MSPKTVVSPPSGVPHPVVEATPPTRRVRLGGNGFEIRSFTLADRDNDRAPGRPWSDGEIALPDDVESSSVRILAAAAHEWSVDLVVQFKRREEYPVRTELWRTSPWRIRRRVPLDVQGVLKYAHFASVDETRGRLVLEQSTRRQVIFHEALVDLRTLAVQMDPPQAQPRRPDLFLSYKDIDTRPIADILVRNLRQSGMDVWFAPDEITGDFREAIDAGIINSRHFVALLSVHSFVGRNPEQIDEIERMAKPVAPTNRAPSARMAAYLADESSGRPSSMNSVDAEDMHGGPRKMNQLEELKRIVASMGTRENNRTQCRLLLFDCPRSVDQAPSDDQGVTPPTWLLRDRRHINSVSVSTAVDMASDITEIVLEELREAGLEREAAP